MPVTFHTKSYADLTFLSDVAKALIELMGHTPNVPGAILANDIPAALARLRTGLAAIELDQPVEEASQTDEEERPIHLSRRAVPLIALLEAAQADHEDVMWD